MAFSGVFVEKKALLSSDSRAVLTKRKTIQSDKKAFPCTMCTVCGKNMASRSSLRHHMRTHTGERPFSCTSCVKTFSTKQALDYHMRTHTGEKPYPCPICGKSFRNRYALTGHIRTHTGVRPFSCTRCVKKFARKDNLVRHMRYHTGENMITCPICLKTLTTQYGFINHMRVHLGEPVSCTDCEKKFSVHELGKGVKFSCVVCGNELSSKCALRRHMRVHTGDQELFSCTLCGKKLGSSQSDTHDMSLLADEKTLSCYVCGKICPTKLDLKCHICVHTPTNSGQFHPGIPSCFLCDKPAVHHGLYYIESSNYYFIGLCEHCQNVSVPCALCGENVSLTCLRTHLGRHTGELGPLS